MGSKIEVTFVEDHSSLRQLWTRKLKAAPDFTVIGSFEDAESALVALTAHPGDLVVVDWKLPGMDGVELVRRLKCIHPNVRTVLITGHDIAELPFAAFSEGVDGFLLKPVPLAELPKRLREAWQGKCPVASGVSRLLVDRLRSIGALRKPTGLSRTEAQVLQLFGEGLETKAVATRLGISPNTVATHKRRAFAKLGAHNLAAALNRWTAPKRAEPWRNPRALERRSPDRQVSGAVR